MVKSHLKKLRTPKTWRLLRKENKYISKESNDWRINYSISQLLISLFSSSPPGAPSRPEEMISKRRWTNPKRLSIMPSGRGRHTTSATATGRCTIFSNSGNSIQWSEDRRQKTEDRKQMANWQIRMLSSFIWHLSSDLCHLKPLGRQHKINRAADCPEKHRQGCDRK